MLSSVDEVCKMARFTPAVPSRLLPRYRKFEASVFHAVARVISIPRRQPAALPGDDFQDESLNVSRG